MEIPGTIKHNLLESKSQMQTLKKEQKVCETPGVTKGQRVKVTHWSTLMSSETA